MIRLACMRHVNTRAIAPPLTPGRVTLTAKEIKARKKARQALADRAYDGASSPNDFTGSYFGGGQARSSAPNSRGES